MRVILEIQNGTLAGNKIRLKPGQLVRLGRTSTADFAFPGDSHMSSIHFAVECDENGCRIYDCNSRNGTLVNDEKISAAGGWLLRDGDQIVAGQTRFLVRTEMKERVIPPAPGANAVPVPMPPEGLSLSEGLKSEDRLLAMLSNEFQPLYAILDTAREPSVLKVLVEAKAEYQSLFEGADGARLTHFAPYLVRLPAESSLLETLTQTSWGKSWGIYLTCGQPLPALRAHFRQFLMVKQPDGKVVYFRYYDPRVLRLYLPTCTPEEVSGFFGPVTYYLIEDEKPDTLLRFSNAVRGAGLKKFPLVPEEKTGAQSGGDRPGPATQPNTVS